MKLKEVLDVAAKAYDEDFPVKYNENGYFKLGTSGNTLAEFVVAELTDTFSPEASDESQLLNAARAMWKASRQLVEVSQALEAKYIEGG